MRQRRIVLIAAFLAAVFCFPLIAGAADDDPCPASSTGEHDWVDKDQYRIVDGTYHSQLYECWDCGATKYVKEKHYPSGIAAPDIVKIDGTYHGEGYSCEACGRYYYAGREKHNWGETETCRNLGNGYHQRLCKCYGCGAAKYEKEAHFWNTLEYDVRTPATLKQRGKIAYTCYDCTAKKTRSIPWKLGTDYSRSYNMTHSVVYRSSNSVTVRLFNPAKGAVLKVKVGKKTYTKKIRNNKKKVKVKIRKTAYGKKVTLKLYYKGKQIGRDDCSHGEDRVLYAKKIKKGMTKKQVKYLYYWGPPRSKSSASGGWSYWHYSDGSYVAFKNGRVWSWYNAAG